MEKRLAFLILCFASLLFWGGVKRWLNPLLRVQYFQLKTRLLS